MNKWIYSLILCVLFSAQACVEEVDDVFDEPASARMEKTLREAKNILLQAPNGWLLEYYSSPEDYGGYTLLLQFKADGTVVVAGESELSDSGMADSVPTRSTSLYQLKSDTGPILSFDTYNSIFHIFSDPQPDGLGFLGDYEFVIEKATSDRIELTGKKHGVKLLLQKFSETEDWNAYLSKVTDVALKAVAPDYSMKLEGEPIVVLSESEYGRTFSFQSSEGKDLGTASYIYTTTGIKFYKPLEVNGKTIEHFDYDPQKEALICTDAGVNAEISLVFTSINEIFKTKPGNWFFNSQLMAGATLDFWNAACRTLEEKKGEKIYYAYLNYDAQEQMNWLRFACSSDGVNGLAGYMSLAYTLVPNTENEVLIEFEGYYGPDETIDYYRNYGIHYLVDALTGFNVDLEYRHFSIQVDNPRLPRKLTFTEVGDPTNQFTLTKKAVYWP